MSDADQCTFNSIIEGQGEFKWPDGRQYFGEFLNGTMNGTGKLIWKDQYGGKANYKGKVKSSIRS